MGDPCRVCKGACCEEFSLPLDDVDPNVAQPDDALRWLIYHGDLQPNGDLRFNISCQHHLPSGRCAVYDERPDVCRRYQPGSPACRDVFQRRRTAAQAAAILRQLDG